MAERDYAPPKLSRPLWLDLTAAVVEDVRRNTGALLSRLGEYITPSRPEVKR